MNTGLGINKWSIISVLVLIFSFFSLFYLPTWGFYLQLPLAIVAGFMGISSLRQVEVNLQRGRMLSIISTTVAFCYLLFILWGFFSADSSTIRSNIRATPMLSFLLLGLAVCGLISKRYLLGVVFVILGIVAFYWSIVNNFVG